MSPSSQQQPVTFASTYANINTALVMLETSLDHLHEMRESKVILAKLDEVATALRNLVEEEIDGG